MRFPYLKQPYSLNPSAPWVSRPFIPVTLSSSDRQVTVYALVDSGADITLFHSSLAKGLGIDLEAGRQSRAYGISGRDIDVYFHRVKLQVAGMTESIELEAGFTDSPRVAALLG